MTCILSALNIKAETTVTFGSIIIPVFNGTYTSSAHKKTVEGPQYAYKEGAKDVLSGDERAIQAKISGVAGEWVDLPQQQIIKLNGGDNIVFKGSYQLSLRAKKWTASTVRFAGIWYLSR